MLQKKRMVIAVVILLCVCLLVLGCQAPQQPPSEDEPVWLDMNMDYPATENLPDGGGRPVKVILLLGQSNATGCSINEYLRRGVGDEQYAIYEQGYPSVLINYCLDDHNATSQGEFVKVDLTCGATDGFFGPEVGMAEVLSKAYPDETIVILKYTMSGYSLHHHWLSEGRRGSIYEAFLTFTQTYMKTLADHHYDASIDVICWMQGESDTTEFKAAHYYDNQTALVSYLREDLAVYAKDRDIYFVDAGISNSPYCEPSYPTINAAKEKMTGDSPLNWYFSTIDEGLTVHLEPEGEPDWGHYDALSGLKLGRLFGERIVQIWQKEK